MRTTQHLRQISSGHFTLIRKISQSLCHWPSSRLSPGKLRLTNHKDRDGVLPAELWFSVGDGEGMLPIRRLESGEPSDDTVDEEYG